MKFEENRDSYIKIATLYYIGELPQDDIAEMFGISRFKVSRILKKCRSMGIVEFHIDKKRNYYESLESQICSLLNIRQAIIVPTGVTPNESKQNAGHAASQYLTDNLKDGMKIGFDWGTTLQTIVCEFAPSKHYPNCLFVQISGSIASQSIIAAGYMDGHDIVTQLATKANANWSLFPVPYIVGSKLLRDMLLEEPAIKKHVSIFPEIDLAFYGVASSNRELRQSFYTNFLAEDECKKMKLPDDCGEIFSRTLDFDGNIIPSITDGRVLIIDLDVLASLPTVVALATGPDKINSLIAGARGGYYHVVIIDEIAALSVIDYFEQNYNIST